MIKNFVIEDKEGKVEKKPFLRVRLRGTGCPLPGCNCSPSNFISISNGHTGMNVALTDEQVMDLLKNKELEITFGAD